jgi:Dolichyl-phosphate-mannose-protein mannosyltransferase
MRRSSATAAERARGLIGGAGRIAREHRALTALLALGAAIRLLTMVAYRPALFFSDSWGYLFTAFTGHPVSLSYLRPNGYPVLIHLLTIPGRSLVRLVALQHLAGLVSGTLVYAGLVRARIGRPAAAAAAALVLLDGYAVTVEQYVMPEAFFTLTLLVAGLLAAWPQLSRAPAGGSSRAGVVRLSLAGLLLAAAVVQREAALFAVPVFLAFLLWTRTGLRALLAFVIACAVPVLGYSALYQARLGVFGLTESGGWTLYGRVAGFADCRGLSLPASEARLCETAAARAGHPDAPTWYIWDGSSPAAKLFGGGHQNRFVQRRADSVLGSFARRIIVHQPLQYAGAVTADFMRYFTPGATAFDDDISATSLPRRAADEAVNEADRRRVIPDVRPAVAAPSGLVRAYRGVIHVPRPLLALLALASLVGVVMRSPARREVTLFSGAALALLLGTAATAGFGLRYLLPAVPLLSIGGSLAARDLLRAWQRTEADRNPAALRPRRRRVGGA